MRSSKYHDYSVLKIALFIILVILGLFIYVKCVRPSLEHTAGEDAWVVTKEVSCTEDGIRCKICDQCGEEFAHEYIPATGHSKHIVKENKIAATCTEGESYDNVERCEYCNLEFSRESVKLDNAKGHNYGSARKENIVTYHASNGSYDLVKNCKVCGAEHREENLPLDPIGHNYTDWSIDYDEEIGKFVVTGCCLGCEEDGNTITLTEDDQNENFTITSTYDARYAPCCKNQYEVEFSFKYEYNGKTVTKTGSEVIELELVPHKLYAVNVVDIDGNVTVGYISVDQFAKYDDYGMYFDIDDEIVAEYVHYDLTTEWSYNGFNVGFFICAECVDVGCDECCDPYEYTWIGVRIYSAAHDQRIVSE